jgi:hypothetical protein
MSLHGAEQENPMEKVALQGYLMLQKELVAMDQPVPLIIVSCAALAVLVYLMWRAATEEEWGQLTQKEKKKWRLDEEKRKEAAT